MLTREEWWRRAGRAFGVFQSPFSHIIFWFVELEAFMEGFGAEADARDNPVWNVF